MAATRCRAERVRKRAATKESVRVESHRRSPPKPIGWKCR